MDDTRVALDRAYWLGPQAAGLLESTGFLVGQSARFSREIGGMSAQGSSST
jgi:hypothetical protein